MPKIIGGDVLHIIKFGICGSSYLGIVCPQTFFFSWLQVAGAPAQLTAKLSMVRDFC